ncbi:hypothetical protein [Myceligenerans pegani]|uniref:Uncharacterized protein n=1 Tax=Myceligenerans pegani TaxID=2776917 RepID=A0ABR9N0V0_9MICO|nr:hypothetical protein [Myceligenerans sp. TRM 65318]MBE1876970.1 hypothetical protein [Myceligenerans sp. TRM 65318]MBE3019241.1 hypothetical protein [Myceligenerans sp. TRM 65318]
MTPRGDDGAPPARRKAREIPPGERSFRGEHASCMMCGKMTVLTWVEETGRYHWIAQGEPADRKPRCDGDTAWWIGEPKLTAHVPKFRRWDYAEEDLLHDPAPGGTVHGGA